MARLYGPPASGKSFLVLDLLMHIASGRAWQGRPVLPGGAAYVAAEGGRGLGGRLNAWLAYHGPGEPALQVLDERVNLLDPRDVEDLIAALGIVRDRVDDALRILVLDTLARCFGAGDENLQRDMNALIAACDAIREALGITVLLVHHSGKGAGRGLRGSSVLDGAADVVLRLTKGRATGLLRLAVEKQKDGPEAAPIGLRLVPVAPGDDGSGSSCVVAAADVREGENERRRLTPSRARVLEIVRAAGAAGLTGPEWRAAVREAGIGPNRPATYREIRAWLLKQGYVVEREGRYCPAGDSAVNPVQADGGGLSDRPRPLCTCGRNRRCRSSVRRVQASRFATDRYARRGQHRIG